MTMPQKWNPKWLREALASQQTYAPDAQTAKVLGLPITVLDEVHRPLGPNGKHGERHTETCGCEDTP